MGRPVIWYRDSVDKYHPLNGHVVIQVEPKDEVSPGGILLPDRLPTSLVRARVLAVSDVLVREQGEPDRFEDSGLRVGQRVLLPSAYVQDGVVDVFNTQLADDVYTVRADSILLVETEPGGLDDFETLRYENE